MKIKNLDIKACIFDLDGTLIDSCSVWAEVDKNFFLRRGMEVPEGYSKAITALGLDESAVYTKNTYGIKESVEEIKAEWMNEVIDKYAHEVPLKDNAKKFLKRLYEQGVPMVIATANSPECYGPCVDRLGITKYFIGAYDVRGVPGGKSSPALFLKCADELNLKPEEILIFEDSIVPLRTAKYAFFKTCAVFDKANKDEEEKNQIADIYIKDYKELL